MEESEYFSANIKLVFIEKVFNQMLKNHFAGFTNRKMIVFRKFEFA